MFLIFKEALYLFARHLPLFSAIVLTVWLPGNILANYVAQQNPFLDQDLLYTKYSIWISNLFGPFQLAAMVYALNQIKRGEHVSYFKAIGAGLRFWIPMLAAKWISGFLVLVGLIGLIVPGLAMAVRYSLIAPAVVVEGMGVNESRRRSIQLTADRRWSIFGAALTYFVAHFTLMFALYLPLEFYEGLNSLWAEVTFDCITDVVYAILDVVLFLYYWDAVAATTVSEEEEPQQNEWPLNETTA